MAKWVRVQTDDTKYVYVNIDKAIRLRVVPTIADSNKYAIVVDMSDYDFYVTINSGPHDTIDAANEVLEDLTQGYDPSE